MEEIKKESKTYSVWVGLQEMNGALLTREEAGFLAKKLMDEGYDEVRISNNHTTKKPLK